MILFFLLLLIPNMSFAQLDDVYYRERDVEQKIAQLAQVQFGAEDIIAVRAHAILVKKIKPPNNKPGADIGYLPLPYKEGANGHDHEEIDEYEINVSASSRANKAALAGFQNSIRSLLLPLKSRVKLQVVQFSEPKERKPASVAPTPTPTPPEKSKDKEIEKDQVTKKDFLYCGIFFLSIFLGSLLVYFGVRVLGRALKYMAETLETVLKKPTLDATVDTEGDEELGRRPDEAVYRKNENMSHNLGVRQSIETLKRYCEHDPLKVVQSFTDGPEDILGLRWLLSQLTDAERAEMKNFLGDQKINNLSKEVEVPQGFNVLSWAQSLIERVAVKKLKDQTLLEKALSNPEIAYLYKVPPQTLLNFAHSSKDPGIWKLTMEIIPGDELSAVPLNSNDWNIIIEGQKTTSEQLKKAFGKLKNHYDPQLATPLQEVGEDKTETVIVPNLIGTLLLMKVAEENDFLRDLKEKQPNVYKAVKKKFWSYSDVERMNPAQLKPVIASQSNEVLFSVLFAAPENERALLMEMIPVGMKRSVVLDLVDKALKKNDDMECRAALKVARAFFDGLMKANQNGSFLKGTEVAA